MRSVAVLVAMLALTAGSAQAQRTPSVLFIGNSFTYGYGSAARFYRSDTVTDLNDEGIGGVPALFESFADQLGLDYDVYLETRSGSGFEFHLENKMAELTSRPWDIVVFHGQSTLDLDNPGDPTKFLTTGQELVQVLHSNNPAVEIYPTATWSRADETYPEDGAWHGEPIEAMAIDVRAAYDMLASVTHGITRISPVGEAFTQAWHDGVADPDPYDGIDVDKLDLWTFDHYHASAAGYYLEALVVFGNVTGMDPRSLGRGECSGFELGFSADQVQALQQVAFEALDADGVTLVTPAGHEPPRRQNRCAVS